MLPPSALCADVRTEVPCLIRSDAVAPAGAPTKSFVTVIVPTFRGFVIVQAADWPRPTVILSPPWVPPVHCQLPAVYPLGPPDSLSVYWPARKPVPLVPPPGPDSGEGPNAEGSQTVAAAVPTPLLSTCLTRVRLGLSS